VLAGRLRAVVELDGPGVAALDGREHLAAVRDVDVRAVDGEFDVLDGRGAAVGDRHRPGVGDADARVVGVDVDLGCAVTDPQRDGVLDDGPLVGLGRPAVHLHPQVVGALVVERHRQRDGLGLADRDGPQVAHVGVDLRVVVGVLQRDAVDAVARVVGREVLDGRLDRYLVAGDRVGGRHRDVRDGDVHLRGGEAGDDSQRYQGREEERTFSEHR